MAEKSGNIYQFKITLKCSKPRIWRRMQVPEEFNLNDLHVAIQCVMGWKNYHLHQFITKSGDYIGRPDLNNFDDSDDSETLAESDVHLDEFFPSPKSKLTYEYDFGDSWKHEVMLESILPAARGVTYPQCLAGKMACPPEDCGGIDGYEDMLEAIADPQHSEHADMKDWLSKMVDGEFDAKAFDPKSVVFRPPSYFPIEPAFKKAKDDAEMAKK